MPDRDWFDYITLFANIFTAIGTVGLGLLTVYFQFFRRPSNLKIITAELSLVGGRAQLNLIIRNQSSKEITIKKLHFKKSKNDYHSNIYGKYNATIMPHAQKDGLIPCDGNVVNNINNCKLLEVTGDDGSVARKKLPKTNNKVIVTK